MIIVDTCVWSETMRPEPSPRVLTWLRDHSAAAALTSVTVGELLAGVAVMPEGKRRDHIAGMVEALIEQGRSRTLAYDEPAARAFASITSRPRAEGRPVATADAMIAAIALANGCSLATRNVRDFDGIGVEVVDPWRA